MTKMKKKTALTLTLSLILFSCVGPETTVTNTVNRDGSILRRVEMSNTENKFLKQQLRVPVDSTWTFIDSISVSGKGDTTWYRSAEKMFADASAVNQAYSCDSGANRDVVRTAFFERRFRWFTTTYYFSETCGKSLLHAFPAEKFLSAEEIEFMNLPRKVKINLLTGSDSSKFRILRDTLDEKSDVWFSRSVISEWIETAGALCEASGKDSMTTEILRSHEDDFFKQLGENAEFDDGCDAVLGAGVYEAFKTEFDSAKTVAEEKFDLSFSFSEYTMQVEMPSEIISTNGYRDPDGRISWPVSGELFLNTDYIMYTQSRSINYWAIIITALLAVILPFDITRHVKQWRKRKK